MAIRAKRSFGKDLDAVIDLKKPYFDGGGSSLLQQELKQVMVYQLSPGKFQPRKEFDFESLQELSSSIKMQGILQPIIVRGTGPEFEIIAGERRWRAAQMAGLQQVPIVVCDISDESALAFGLIENIQRKSLNVIEEAEAVQKLINDFAMTHQKVAESIGRSRAAVSNMLRLLQLTKPVKNLLIEGRIEMGHARALLPLEPNLQVEVANKIISGELNVRDSEKIARVAKPKATSKVPVDPCISERASHLSQRLKKELKTSVSLKVNQKGEGTLVIKINSFDEVESLLQKIK